MENKPRCSSCNKEITNDTGATTFKCPNCGMEKVTRCLDCRKLASRYTCKKCGFSGPN